MSYNWLTSKFNVEWGFREGALERTFEVADGEELYEGMLVAQAPEGAQAGKVLKTGDISVAADNTGPGYNVLPGFKQGQGTGVDYGAALDARTIWMVVEGNMTPSGIGCGGHKAVCLCSGFIVKTQGFKAGTYNPGDAVTADEAQFAAQSGGVTQIGTTDVWVSDDMHPVATVLEYDSAEGTLVLEVH